MRMRRAFLGLSQADLALAVGVSVWRIWRIERGLSRPREDELKRIVEVLGLDAAIFHAVG
jgi:predicted transcriptional regulator